MISAKIVGDSVNEFGNRITTMVVTFPRIILAEFNTHRMFSRNSASSRAIPFTRMVKSVQENPFIPIAWQKNHTGMQGTEYLTAPIDISYAHDAWLEARDYAIRSARVLYQEGQYVTKQLCNRLLETYMYHTVIVTATEWENFFALRCPHYQIEEIKGVFRSKKDYIKASRIQLGLIEQEDDYNVNDWLKINKGQAEIHMMALAEAMWDAYNESTPKKLEAGEWHIPFKEQILEQSKTLQLATDQEEVLKKIATVMAARTSYTVVGEDLKPLTYQRMIEIHDEMAKANPKHMSPFEHCAQARSKDNLGEDGMGGYGNFRGWIQYRKMIPNENIIL